MSDETKSPDPDQLRERIERVYQTLEGKRSSWGAQTWFAKEAGVSPVSVSRWLTDGKEHRPILPTALALLSYMERLAKIEKLVKGNNGDD